MKKVEGRSLRQVLVALAEGDEATTAEFTRTRLLHSFIQVCNAVAYANDRGVLHRDLKPDNVMLGAFGEVLLMDWGVARLAGDVTEVTSTEAIEKVAVAKTQDGAAIGTPGFMSPEQAQGNLHELDARSDVWSLGAILYELLTLRSAYSAPNVYALMFAAMSGPPEDPRTRAPQRNVPDEIAEVCLQAMSSERQDRFTTASELAAAVGGVHGGQQAAGGGAAARGGRGGGVGALRGAGDRARGAAGAGGGAGRGDRAVGAAGGQSGAAVGSPAPGEHRLGAHRPLLGRAGRLRAGTLAGPGQRRGERAAGAGALRALRGG